LLFCHGAARGLFQFDCKNNKKNWFSNEKDEKKESCLAKSGVMLPMVPKI